jgi:hypothetical protein
VKRNGVLEAALSSARCIRAARGGSRGLASIAFLVACSCRAVPDGSTAPAPTGVSEPSTPELAAPQRATVQPPATSAAIPEPAAPKLEAPLVAPLAEPSETKPPATPAAVAQPQAIEGDALMLRNLEDALRETPFSAVVQHLRVKVIPLGSDEVKFVYDVRVIENIRGPKLKKLSYFAIAEKGEDPGLTKEPVILTLCKDQEGFYWPGTGAEFPRTKSARAVVDKLRPELSADQKVFEQCEDP